MTDEREPPPYPSSEQRRALLRAAVARDPQSGRPWTVERSADRAGPGTRQWTAPQTDSVDIPAGYVVRFVAVGGGGAAGHWRADDGRAATRVTGAIAPRDHAWVLHIHCAQGGQIDPGSSGGAPALGGPGGSGYVPGGDGGWGSGWAAGGGGGGGGASALFTDDDTIMIVAPGGGGGGGGVPRLGDPAEGFGGAHSGVGRIRDGAAGTEGGAGGAGAGLSAAGGDGGALGGGNGSSGTTFDGRRGGGGGGGGGGWPSGGGGSGGSGLDGGSGGNGAHRAAGATDVTVSSADVGLAMIQDLTPGHVPGAGGAGGGAPLSSAESSEGLHLGARGNDGLVHVRWRRSDGVDIDPAVPGEA